MGRSSRLPDVALIAELRDPLPATDAAIAAGLLEWSPSGEVQFPHPLLRAAVYDDMSLTRRRALHLAVAATASDEAALDHRAAAAYEYDSELAGELEAVAARDAAGGRPSLAARRLRQAAALSAGAQDRDRRVLMATEVLFGAGMMAAGRTLADDVRACRESAYRSFVLGCIAFAEGRVADGESLVTAAAEQARRPGRPGGASCSGGGHRPHAHGPLGRCRCGLYCGARRRRGLGRRYARATRSRCATCVSAGLTSSTSSAGE